MSIDFLHEPARVPHFGDDRQITNFMHLIWLSRPDLQAAFDIADAGGQTAFIGWAENSIQREYGLAPIFAGKRGDDPCSANLPKAKRSLLHGLWSRLRGDAASTATQAKPGATLIGYADGVLGMGEHVRMSAHALIEVGLRFGVLNVDSGIYHKRSGVEGDLPLVSGNAFRANIFHVNADQMLSAYCTLGADFFRDRYNIGFWAWELALCPENWLPVIEMVDEIWAPSRFIRDSFAAVTDKPVTLMPLCVELPAFKRQSRAHFGLPADNCLFLYTFDFLSYMDRKNPFAAIRAFKLAFPDRSTAAGLVLKVMKGDEDAPKWQQMLALIDGDPRIHVINEVMDRGDVLALLDCCDCFLSLHRSEGFGRGPAEAMYLGKPVIVTNYSGNLDFTRPGACLLVDYRLVPVGPEEYVFTEGQVWAEVDENQAAAHMRLIVAGGPEIEAMAERGRQIILTEFSDKKVGELMKQRLLEQKLVEP